MKTMNRNLVMESALGRFEVGNRLTWNNNDQENDTDQGSHGNNG